MKRIISRTTPRRAVQVPSLLMSDFVAKLCISKGLAEVSRLFRPL